MTKATGPDVFRYLDHRLYLRDWFDAKKLANPRFSHRLFARLAGQGSPSLLIQVIRGNRNLTSATTEAFITAMGLRGEAAEFFGRLVALDAARTEEERNAAWSHISASRRFRAARELEGAGFEYLSKWYLPAIRELAWRADFVPDPAWIATTLRPKITEAQARKALGLLRSMGLLTEDEDGRTRPADGSVVTPHEVASLAVRNYHRGMLELARDSIDAFPGTERHLSAVTVCIPKSLVPRIKRELDAFQERLLDLCDAEVDRAEQVHQIHLVLFPLSTAGGAPS
jgi:uncharacterized protein (TIGR02147 family)